MWVWIHYDVWGNESDGWDINDMTRTSWRYDLDYDKPGRRTMCSQSTDDEIRLRAGLDPDTILNRDQDGIIECQLPNGRPTGRLEFDPDAD